MKSSVGAVVAVFVSACLAANGSAQQGTDGQAAAEQVAQPSQRPAGQGQLGPASEPAGQQSEPGPGRGFGRGFGMRHGRGAAEGRGAGDARHDDDRDVFHFLLANHDKIKRTVKLLPDGVSTLTESNDDQVADRIKEHVYWMQQRIANTQPIRMRDPLFAEIFRHADKIKMQHEETQRGVRVTETSDDPYVAKLIQAHAEVVSGFVRRGFREAMSNHAVPPR